jgi:hypothetical protein
MATLSGEQKRPRNFYNDVIVWLLTIGTKTNSNHLCLNAIRTAINSK